jgi:hypothetical protein
VVINLMDDHPMLAQYRQGKGRHQAEGGLPLGHEG